MIKILSRDALTWLSLEERAPQDLSPYFREQVLEEAEVQYKQR
jgi:hypothetical protein